MGALSRLVIHSLAGARNEAESVRQVLRDQGTLRPGQRLDGPDVEFIVGACEPKEGQYHDVKTEVIVADKILKVFKKVHVLPYADTFKYNYDHMYHEHLVPYYHNCQCGEFTVGNDFAHEGVRFQVVGVLPEDTYGVVGQATEIFYEGPPIERKVLERLQLVPFEDGLPEKYRPSKLTLDEGALLRDYVRPHFELRSAQVAPGEIIPINGVDFKVVACRPSAGGGVGRDTELACQGVALKKAFAAPATAKASGKARPKAGASAKALAAQRRQNDEGPSAGRASGPGPSDQGSGCVIA